MEEGASVFIFPKIQLEQKKETIKTIPNKQAHKDENSFWKHYIIFIQLLKAYDTTVHPFFNFAVNSLQLQNYGQLPSKSDRSSNDLGKHAETTIQNSELINCI